MERPTPLSVREAASELDCSEDAVRRLIRDGELQTVACGVRPGLIPRHVFEAYLRRQRARSSRTP